MKNPALIVSAFLFLPLLAIQGKEPVAPDAALPVAPTSVSGPTKEQTVAFIKTRAVGGFYLNGWDGERETTSNEFNTRSLSGDGCVLTLFIDRTSTRELSAGYMVLRDSRQRYTREVAIWEYEYEIPMHLVISVERVERKNIDGGAAIRLSCDDKSIGYGSLDRALIYSPGEKYIERSRGPIVRKPNAQASVVIPVPEKDADQLVKAFNHLRKLCGAPEPLSFD